MKVKIGTKKDLIEILAGNHDSLDSCFGNNMKPNLSENDLAFVWHDDACNDQLAPNAIVVNDFSLSSFLAWAHTFFPGYRPFTAYFQVLTESSFGLLNSRKPRIQSTINDNIIAGIIIAEAITLSPQLTDPSQLKIIPCLSTLSYSIAQAFLRGATEKEQKVVSEAWSDARDAIGIKVKINPMDITSIWNILSRSFCDNLKGINKRDQRNGDKYIKIEKSLQAVASTGSISRNSIISTLNKNEKYVLLCHKLFEDLSREEKMSIFEQAMELIPSSDIADSQTTSFLCALMASSIAPGSFAHYKLVVPHLNIAPLSIIWYGIISGACKNSDALSSFNALGRRIVRDLRNNLCLSSSPKCDIGFGELKMLLNSNKKDLGIRSVQTSSTATEIFPDIITHLAWPRPPMGQEKSLNFNDQTFLNIYNELGKLLHKSVEIYDHLLPSNEYKFENSEQGSLLKPLESKHARKKSRAQKK